MDFNAQMLSFHALLPDVAANETRVIKIADSRLGIKPGDYFFMELYCVDKDCDCRRAMIQVTDPSGTVYATLSYGWESLKFYQDWMYGDRETAREIAGINLYELQPQSSYARKFLDIFREMLTDQTLAERYQRHYSLFKAAVAGQLTPAKRPVDLEEMRKQRRKMRRRAQSSLHP